MRNDAWANVTPELAARTKDVLRDLLMFSYAPTSKLDPNKVSSGKTGARPPRQVDSLYEEYVAKFSPAVIKGDEKRVEKLCVQAEREVREYRGQETEREAEYVLEGEEHASRIVVERYEGVPAARVAHKLTGMKPEAVAHVDGHRVRQHVTVDWVCKVRQQSRRDPDDGTRLPGWRGLTEDERRREVEKRWGQGMKIEDVAGALNVTRQTLQKYWPGRQAA